VLSERSQVEPAPSIIEGTTMEHYAGIDVSLESASVCGVDAAGWIVREAKIASEPDALNANSIGFRSGRQCSSAETCLVCRKCIASGSIPPLGFKAEYRFRFSGDRVRAFGAFVRGASRTVLTSLGRSSDPTAHFAMLKRRCKSWLCKLVACFWPFHCLRFSRLALADRPAELAAILR
jgi:hypothetical protein